MHGTGLKLFALVQKSLRAFILELVRSPTEIKYERRIHRNRIRRRAH